MSTIVIESSNTVLQQSDASSVIVAPSEAGTLIQTGLMGPISSADKYHMHDQMSASDVWTITHSLEKYPSVTIVDSAGDEVEGSVNHISTSTIVVTFSAPFSGRAYLN